MYDDAQSSYSKAIKKYFPNLNVKVYSIGINDIVFPKSEKFFYKRIDLSLNNFNVFSELRELPHPHIILASPPCESWSKADCNGRMTNFIKDDGLWFVKNKKYYDQYNNECHPVKRRYFLQKERTRLVGESTIGATIAIIQEFKPLVWVIENPQSSLTWDFQKCHWGFDGHHNLTYYSAYDPKFSLKPTIFKSNYKLNLKDDRISGDSRHMSYGSYSQRSAIPSLLIKDMLEQLLSHLEGDKNVG